MGVNACWRAPPLLLGDGWCCFFAVYDIVTSPHDELWTCRGDRDYEGKEDHSYLPEVPGLHFESIQEHPTQEDTQEEGHGEGGFPGVEDLLSQYSSQETKRQ